MPINYKTSILKYKDKQGVERDIIALQGKPGATPVKGVDYFTDADKQEIIAGIDDKLDNVIVVDDSEEEEIELATTSELNIVDEKVDGALSEINKLGQDVAKTNNDMETPAPAGQVWTATEDGAEWKTPTGSSFAGLKINGIDVQPDAEGKCNVPAAANYGEYGVVKISSNQGIGLSNGALSPAYASNALIDSRAAKYPIGCGNLDYAVKAAMCDGKGAAWSAQEQAAGRERMGISSDEYALVSSIILDEQTNIVNITNRDDGVSFADCNYHEMIVWVAIPPTELISVRTYLRVYNSTEHTSLSASCSTTTAYSKTDTLYSLLSVKIVNDNYVKSEHRLMSNGSSVNMTVQNAVDARYGGYNKCWKVIIENNGGLPAGTRIMVYAR